MDSFYCLDLPELASIQLGFSSFPFLYLNLSDTVDTSFIMRSETKHN